MNVFQAIHNLRTTTKFLDKPVDEKMIGLILYSATRALSAGNLQEWEFVVVEDEKTKERLANATGKLDHVKKAPSVIIVCTDLQKAALKYGKRGELVYSLEDASFATQTLLIVATALGVGYDLIRAFDEDLVKGAINLPDNIRPVAIIPIGFSAEEKESGSRTPFEDKTYVDRYGNKINVEFQPIFMALEKNMKEMQEKYYAKVPSKPFTLKDFLKFLKSLLK